MFTTLYRCPHTIARHENGPLRESRRRYLEHLAAQEPGYGTTPESQRTRPRQTATHLLRAGVDINTVRSWLGHVSLDTTQVYAEIDLEMKVRALEKCSTADVKKPTVASDGPLMAFLRAI